MRIRRIQSLANDHPEDLNSISWTFLEQFALVTVPPHFLYQNELQLTRDTFSMKRKLLGYLFEGTENGE